LPGIELVAYDDSERNNYQYLVVEVDETVSPLSRDQWLQVLHAENVLARRYFYPGVHRMAPYAGSLRASFRLPQTEALLGRVLVLPTGTAVSTDAIETIGEIFRAAVNEASRLRHQLPQILPLPTAPRKAA
jgi:dTDP-4-amino-4,6-dideoxygalactose transaminase